MGNIPGVSVIICCYNSAAVIGPTLQYLALQQFNSSVAWELILVDNNCTDNTVAVAGETWTRSGVAGVPLVVTEEKRPGLSFARRAGVSTAKYNVIIFCDDDNRLCNSYVDRAFSIMEKDHSIGAIGGKGIAVADVSLPAWWKDHQHGYAVGEQANASGDVTKRMFLWGAGIVLRKNIMLEVFDEKFPFLLVDRQGVELSSGGDSEICARIVLMGYKLWYDENLLFEHYITEGRLANAYRDKIFEGHEKASATLEKYYRIIHLNGLPVVLKIRTSLKLMLQAIFAFAFPKNKQVSGKTTFGALWGLSLGKGDTADDLILKYLQRYKK